MKRQKEIAWRPGYILALEIRRSGGITYDREQLREEQEGERLESEFKTSKRVDNVGIVRRAAKLCGSAYYAVARTCAATPLGYFADATMLAKLEAELVPIREEAAQLNDDARTAGSGVRVTIGVYPLELALDNEAAARRIAEIVAERLAAVRDALRAADPEAVTSTLRPCRNLERLATGIHADAVRLALEQAAELRAQIGKATKEGYSPEEIAEALDTGALDNAIALFDQPAEELAA